MNSSLINKVVTVLHWVYKISDEGERRKVAHSTGILENFDAHGVYTDRKIIPWSMVLEVQIASNVNLSSSDKEKYAERLANQRDT